MRALSVKHPLAGLTPIPEGLEAGLRELCLPVVFEPNLHGEMPGFRIDLDETTWVHVWFDNPNNPAYPKSPPISVDTTTPSYVGDWVGDAHTGPAAVQVVRAYLKGREDEENRCRSIRSGGDTPS